MHGKADLILFKPQCPRLSDWAAAALSTAKRRATHMQGLSEMELAGLEPATSWMRYRVRKPNRGDLSSLGCSEFI
jgi:hypothetical protein